MQEKKAKVFVVTENSGRKFAVEVDCHETAMSFRWFEDDIGQAVAPWKCPECALIHRITLGELTREHKKGRAWRYLPYHGAEWLPIRPASKFFDNRRALLRELQIPCHPDECWSCRSAHRQLIFLKVAKDLDSLGVRPPLADQRLFLCIPCAAIYMNSFNRAHAQYHGKEPGPDEWTPNGVEKIFQEHHRDHHMH